MAQAADSKRVSDRTAAFIAAAALKVPNLFIISPLYGQYKTSNDVENTFY